MEHDDQLNHIVASSYCNFKHVSTDKKANTVATNLCWSRTKTSSEPGPVQMGTYRYYRLGWLKRGYVKLNLSKKILIHKTETDCV